MKGRETERKRGVSSPSAVMPLLTRSGCVQAVGVPYHIHCTCSRGLEVRMCACVSVKGGVTVAVHCDVGWEPWRKCSMAV